MTLFDHIIQAIRDDDQARLVEILPLVDLHTRGPEGLSLVESAIAYGRSTALRILLERGAPLEQEHLLSATIVLGDLDRVRTLLRTADLNRAGSCGTPLMIATRAGAIEILNFLLSSGADPEVRNREGGNILETAAFFADPRVVEVLIRGGAGVNSENKAGETPLLRMLSPVREFSPGRVECVRLLVRAGARLYYQREAEQEVWCALCSVVSTYDGFSEGHASALAQLLASGGQALIQARGGPALCAAIEHGHVPAVKALLQAGAPADFSDDYGRSPILLAVHSGRADILAALLEAGASADTLDERDQSLIVPAVHGGHADILAVLLQRGARVPLTDNDGRSLLLQARAAADPRVAELLAPYDSPTKYPRSPGGLADAVTAGDLESVERLLDTGMDPNMEGPGRWTMLNLAASMGHAAIIRALVIRGAAIDDASTDRTPLDAAIMKRHIQCVRTLIELGCNVNAKSSFSRVPSPLWYAADAGELDIVRLLLEAGAEPYLDVTSYTLPIAGPKSPSYVATMDVLLTAMRDPKKRRATLKHRLRDAIYDQSLYVIRYILERAPELYDEPDDDYKERPLEGAAARGNAQIMRLLLSYGSCRLEGSGPRGMHTETPLMKAVAKGKLEAVGVLVEAGANVRVKERRLGYTPLMFACYMKTSPEYPQIVDLLLDHDADLDVRANDGQTAVMMAVQKGLYGVVEALLRHGPDLSARDTQGRDVFDLAQERGVPALIELLHRHRRRLV